MAFDRMTDVFGKLPRSRIEGVAEGDQVRRVTSAVFWTNKRSASLKRGFELHERERSRR